MGLRRNRLTWREPLAYHRRRSLDGYRRIGVFSFRFWTRASLPGLVAAATLAACIRLRYPGAWIPVWQLGFALASVPPVLITLILVEALLLPREITVTPRRINSIHRSRILRLRIEEAPAAGRMLIVRYRTNRNSEATFRTPIPARIGLGRLIEVLPAEAEILTRSGPSPRARTP